MRLLIVDDSKNERMILKKMLKSEGYAVQEAENGQQALERVLLSPPDMIISDILMPVMDGFKLCREIKADNRTCDIPVVFFTGMYTKTEDENFAFKMGADRFLVKSMGWEVFFRKLKDVIREKEMGKESIQTDLPKDERDGKEIYKLYNEWLIKKLEDKVFELEREAGLRKKLENQLHDSQESLQTAFEGANIGMWDWNVQTGDVKINQQLSKNFGYDPEELFPHVDTWKKMMHPEDRQKTMDVLKANLDGKTSVYENEHRIRNKDGQWRWFFARGKVVDRDESGNPLRHMGTFLDIHNHKVSQNELEKEKERYRLIFNTAPVGIFHYGADSVITECNPRTYQIFGTSPETAIGFNQLENMRDKEMTKAIRISLAGKPAHFQGSYASVLSGKTLFLKAGFVPVFSDVGTVLGGVGVVEDFSVQVKAMEAVAKSEKKYRTILESIEDGYYEVDLCGNLVFFNNALCNILGYSESELTALNYRSFMDSENATKTFQMFNQVFNTKSPSKGFDWEIKRKDGAGRYLDTSIVLIQDDQGNAAGFRGISRDVTDRRLMEKFLAESEERYRLIFDAAPVGIVFYDQNGQIKDCNQAFLDINGVSHENIEGLYLIKEVKDNRVIAALKSSLAGKASHFTGTCISLSGNRNMNIKADFEPVISEGGKRITGGICVVEDISEKIESEKAFRESEEKARALLNATNDAVVLIEKDGNILDVNDTMARRFYKRINEMMGKCIWDFLPPEIANPREKNVRHVFETGKASNMVDERDGVWNYINFYPLFSRTGGVTRVAVFAQDITDQKKAEDELKRSHERLRNLSAYLHTAIENERKSIARGIHDDLGQTLTAIKMDAVWMQNKIPADWEMINEKSKSTISLVDSAIQTVQRISAELRPGLLDDLGLAAAIEWQAVEYQKRSGINIQVII